MDRSGGQERGGDEISFLEALEGLDKREAIARYLDLAGVEKSRHAAPVRNLSPIGDKSGESFNWRSCVEKFGDDLAGYLIKGRGYSAAFVAWLKSQELVGSVGRNIAFPVHNEAGKIVTAHARYDDGKWFYLPKGKGVHPLIIGPIATATKVMVFESQWDALAVMDAVRWHEAAPAGWAVIATRGAGNGKFAARAAGAVYAWPQNDEEKDGKRAGEVWFSDVVAAARGPVHRVHIPPDFKDANDWTRARPVDVMTAIENSEPITKPARDPGPLVVLPPDKAVTEGPPFDPVAFLRENEIYNLDGKELFYMREGDGSKGVPAYSTLTSKMLGLELRARGVSAKRGEFEPLSQAEKVVLTARRNNRINWAGSLGGYFPGEQLIDGYGRSLILEGPTLPVPVPGSSANIEQFLFEFYGPEQLPFILGYLKHAFLNLRDGVRKPGQTVINVGPADGGKGFFQSFILKPILGGREADLSGYLFEGDKQNEDMFSAELLVVDELPTSMKHADREKFGEQLKKLTKAQSGRRRGMHQAGKTVHTFRRVLISCNTQKVKMLPPFDADFTEALMLFRVSKADAFFNSFPNYTAASETVLAEIPAFLDLLIKMPDNPAMFSRRYGVKKFMNHDLAKEIFESEKWFLLLMMIDRELFRLPTDPVPWNGRVMDLIERLHGDDSKVKLFAMNFPKDPGTIGQYLGQAAEHYPGRVQKVEDRKNNRRGGWVIHPPTADE